MKSRFNKFRIYILFFHLCLLSMAIYCTIIYNRQQEVIATTEPFFVKKEQVTRRGGYRRFVDITIQHNNKTYDVRVTDSQEKKIEKVPLYYDIERDEIIIDETIYFIIIWGVFFLFFISWMKSEFKKQYLWAIDDKGKRPRKLAYDYGITWQNGETFELWEHCKYAKLTRSEYKLFVALLKDEMNKNEDTLTYEHYFVQYFGYIVRKERCVYANLYGYEAYTQFREIPNRYLTVGNTKEASKGGRNFVQVHINLDRQRVESLKINAGKSKKYTAHHLITKIYLRVFG